jgi:hypothetical protein
LRVAQLCQTPAGRKAAFFTNNNDEEKALLEHGGSLQQTNALGSFVVLGLRNSLLHRQNQSCTAISSYEPNS